MGLFDRLKGNKEDTVTASEEEQGEQDPKYPEQACALCGKTGTEKKWAGQFWHKKCYRKMRKVGKGML